MDFLSLVGELKSVCQDRKNKLVMLEPSIKDMINEHFEFLRYTFIEEINILKDGIIEREEHLLDIDEKLYRIDNITDYLDNSTSLEELIDALDECIKSFNEILYERQKLYYQKKNKLKKEQKLKEENELIEKILILINEKKTYYDIAKELNIKERKIKYLLQKKRKMESNENK